MADITINSPTYNLSLWGLVGVDQTTLLYTWAALSGPAVPTFSPNGTNAAQNTTVAFSASGTYSLLLTATSPGGDYHASWSVTANVTLPSTTMVLLPGNLRLPVGAFQTFNPWARDSSGTLLTSWTRPALTWSLSGPGSLAQNGVYIAPASPGAATITATGGGFTATATVNVVALTPGFTFDSTGVVWIYAPYWKNVVVMQKVTTGEVDYLAITLQSTNQQGALVLGQTQQYVLSQVQRVEFLGQSASFINAFTNVTTVPCNAYGGGVVNQLVGGSADDSLYAAGAGSTNSLSGKGGVGNLLVGGAGTNYFYGGGGTSQFVPGTGTNYFYPNS